MPQRKRRPVVAKMRARTERSRGPVGPVRHRPGRRKRTPSRARSIRLTYLKASRAHQAVAMARYALVNRVITRDEHEGEFEAIARVCREENEKAKDRDDGTEGARLAETTLRRWVAWFRAHKFDGLVPQYRSDRGARRVQRTKKQKTVPSRADIDHVIEALVCSKRGAKVVFKHLRKRWPAVTWKRKSVERWVREWKAAHPHLVELAHEGEGRFLNRKTLHLGWAPVAPLELSVLDSTQLDLYIAVEDLKTKKLVEHRPWVSLMLDVGSRAVLTFEVTLGRPSAGSVRSLLRRAWCAGENWPGLPTVAVPQRFRVDAGPEHHGAFSEALAALGLAEKLVPGPPEKQAHIERAIGSVLSQRAVEDLIGHSKVDRPAHQTDTSGREHARGTPAAQRENRRIERDIRDLLTLDELLGRLIAVCIEHNATVHRGLEKQAYNQRAAARAA